MELFELGRVLHGTAGSVALVTFWIAAFARKGGDRHRSAGRIYLLAMIAVMTLSTLMVAGRAVQGDAGTAIFLAFLISLVGTSSWLMWFSIRYRGDATRLHGSLYRTLASWLIAAGAALFFLGVSRRAALTMFLSLLGLGFGVNMWRLALEPVRDRGWWLRQHMNGAMLNFIATHDSFLALGIGSVVPGIRQSVPRMLVAVSVTLAGVALRAWYAPRQARAAAPPRGSSPASV
jgi:hypothetical protein